MTGYPVFLDLTGRQVTLVGAGAVGARRLAPLLAAGARVVVVDPAPSAEISRRAESRELSLRRRPFDSADVDGSWLVHACTDDPAVNESVADAAERRGIWCVRADAADRSAAHTPASGTVDEITVAVTASRDPRRARAVRELILAGLRDGSLQAAPRRGARGSVALVGGGPGDPELLTVRARRLLLAADVVVADRLGPRDALTLPPHIEVIDAGKRPGGGGMSQDDINAVLVERGTAGQAVVRLKGGDPFVFGRGSEELAACAAAGIDVQVVPGVSSVLAAPACAGIPLTARGVTEEFVVASGHTLPGTTDNGLDWAGVVRGGSTIILLMAVHNVAEIVRALIRLGAPADRPAACVASASLPDERVLHSRLGRLAADIDAAGLTAPAVLIIGNVVELAQDWPGSNCGVPAG